MYSENDYRNYLMHADHKYLEKIVNGARTRYFYTRDALQAYYNNLKNKAGAAVNKLAGNIEVRTARAIRGKSPQLKAYQKAERTAYKEGLKNAKQIAKEKKRYEKYKTKAAKSISAKNTRAGLLNVHKTNKGYRLGGKIGNKVRSVTNALRHPIKSISSKVRLSKYSKKYYQKVYNSKISEWKQKAETKAANQAKRKESHNKRGSYSSKTANGGMANISSWTAKGGNGGRSYSESLDKALSAYGIYLGNTWAGFKSQMKRNYENSDYNKYIRKK